MNILDELHNDFMVYAKEVNESRAFPDAADGLKPVQRAALYEMYDKGYSSNKPHVKSAKITGGTIGSWWPHGDTSVYETVVRMSQPWINNIPEIDWHGANGSVVGGPEAASQRYTECRLSKASEDGLFNHIDEDTVDFIPNYSEDLEWPKSLPAIFPRLFVNGGSGVGYTIANSWPLGNLGEFTSKVKEYLDKGDISYDNIYPDFPSKGTIINKKEMAEMYKTGKGSITLRGKATINGNTISITELPYQVYVEQFINEVKDLVDKDKLDIDEIFNKSGDKNGLLIEIECKYPEDTLAQLYKQTDLQIKYKVNQMALVNGTPEMLSLLDYIKVYTDYNRNCIVREYTTKKIKANNRLEIVNGLLKAIPIIDTVISEIKKSQSQDEAKLNLINLGFTENQAKAIIDLKLGRLTRLETGKLDAEKKELEKTIKQCDSLLKSTKQQNKELLNRLEDFTNKYGYDRRTEVVDIEEEVVKTIRTKHIEEDYFIILTTDNRLKRVKLSEYRKTIEQTIKVNKKDSFVLLTTDGMMYKIKCNQVPLCSQKASGILVSELRDIKSDILGIYQSEQDKEQMLLITEKGMMYKTLTSHFKINKQHGTILMTLDNDKIVSISFLNDGEKAMLGDKQLDVKLTSRRGAKGVKIKYVRKKR